MVTLHIVYILYCHPCLDTMNLVCCFRLARLWRMFTCASKYVFLILPNSNSPFPMCWDLCTELFVYSFRPWLHYFLWLDQRFFPFFINHLFLFFSDLLHAFILPFFATPFLHLCATSCPWWACHMAPLYLYLSYVSQGSYLSCQKSHLHDCNDFAVGCLMKPFLFNLSACNFVFEFWISLNPTLGFFKQTFSFISNFQHLVNCLFQMFWLHHLIIFLIFWQMNALQYLIP